MSRSSKDKRSSICCDPVKYGKREPLSILQESDVMYRKLLTCEAN